MEIISDPKNVLMAIPLVVVGINELCKRLGMPTKLAPLVNVGLGILFAIYPLLQLGLEPFYAFFMSIVIGLSSGGLYSGVKKMAE